MQLHLYVYVYMCVCKFLSEFTWTRIPIYCIAQGRMHLWLNTWYLIFCLPPWQKHQLNICTWMKKFNLTCSIFLWMPGNFILWGWQVFSAGVRSFLTKNSPGAQWWHFGISLFRHKLLEGMDGQIALSYIDIEHIRDIFSY